MSLRRSIGPGRSDQSCLRGGRRSRSSTSSSGQLVVQMGNKTAKGDLPFPMLISITSDGDSATKWRSRSANSG